MVGDTRWCEISNIQLQRYTDTGPRPGTRPQVRHNGIFDKSEVGDNETPLYFIFQSPCENSLFSTVEPAEQFTRQATTAVLVHETTPGKL